MAVRYDIKGEMIIIYLPEELDHKVATDIKKQADEVIYSGQVMDVEFDFTDTRFMDSSGIGMIMGRYKLVHPLGGHIYVSGVGSNVARIIKISGLHKLVIERVKESTR